MVSNRTSRLALVPLAAFILLAGTGCDDSNPVKPDPHAPTLTVEESPMNRATEQPLSITFTWSSADPDGDSLVHDIYFGTASSPALVVSDMVDTSYTVTDLDAATKYWWRIVAKDSTGRQTATGTRSFTTYSFVYPLAVRNRWAYTEVAAMTIVGPDTTQPPVVDTVHGVSYLRVASLDRLSDSLVAYRIYALLIQDSSRYESMNWFNNTDDGLYSFAYKGTGSFAIPLKTQPGMTFTLLGRQFSSLEEIVTTIRRTLRSPTASSGTSDLEDPPVKCLQYPLTIGSQWTARTTDNPWRIDKQVTGHEQIEVTAGIFDAYKIKWLYDLDADGNWDAEISIVDHIADVGLVKRVISVTGIEATTEWGDLGGYVEFSEVIQLTRYQVD